MKNKELNPRKIKQHEDLRTDPQYRHMVHRSKKEVLEKQVDYEYEKELKEFIKYGKETI